MQKPAETNHPVIEPVKQRWSPRAFAERPVAPDTLRRLLEAARWAPSSFNEQPWRFIIATKDDPDAYQRLYHCLKENNQRWAGNAPVLLLSLAKTTFTRNDKPNRHAWHDVGLAMGNLLAQATAEGLFVHQMAGIDRDKTRETYNVPDDFDVIAAAAIGYGGDPDILDDKLKERELKARQRRPLSETVFDGAFGKAAPLVVE